MPPHKALPNIERHALTLKILPTRTCSTNSQNTANVRHLNKHKQPIKVFFLDFYIFES